MIPFMAYALPVITVLAVAALGSTRRLGFWWTLVAAVALTPVGGFIAALLSGRRRFKRPREPSPGAPSRRSDHVRR